jgi:hypothetical protein
MVHQHPNKAQVTMAVAEEKRPHTRKRTPTTIVASETMFPSKQSTTNDGGSSGGEKTSHQKQDVKKN